MVSIGEVARKAGVSVGTVSRVINRNAAVRAEYRERVERAVRELDYRPNPFARSLRRQESLTFGLIVPDVTYPFFAELVKHADDLAALRGYCIVLGNSNNRGDIQQRYIDIFSERRLDGVLLVPSMDTRPRDLDGSVPVVIVDRGLKGFPLFASDHRGGAETAVTYLIRLGHRRIACIAGPETLTLAQERVSGFRAALAALPKRQRPTGQVRFTEFDYVGGHNAALALLQGPARPTAIFANSDQQAIGALRAAADLGLAVPRDVSIVGFDDVPLATHLAPRLTTVRQDVRRIADLALQHLEKARTNGIARRSVIVPTVLQVRESSGPPPPENKQ